MSIRHFKRLQLCTKKPEKVSQVEEVCSISSDNCLNSATVDKVIETTVVEVTENCNNNTNQLIPKMGCCNNKQINSLNDLRYKINTADTLNPQVNFYNDDSSSIKDKLQQWVLAYNIKKNSVNSLLKILRSEGLDLPKDVRTLMHTPRSHDIISMDPGTYIHLGLKEMLLIILKFNTNCLRNVYEISLSFNIDGLPLAHSSKQQFWPILCSIINVPFLSKLVFAIGLYFSALKKPESIDDFLNLFINEAIELVKDGINVDDKVLRISIKQFICDSPAKAFLLNVKGHNSRVGCNTCLEEGEYKEHRMAFLGVNAALRTNESFRARSDDEYHKGNSPLERLSIDMIKSVPIDYMHAVCLGAMKRLLKFWVRGKQSTRIPLEKCDAANVELNNLRDFFPSEFVRLPRSLNDIEYWKANEFRTFLLFTGPIILKGRLKKQFYFHFIKLHCAIKILVTPALYSTKNEIAYNLLVEFVKEFKNNYGAHFMTHNIHSLIHLPYYAKIHGCLDNFSAFKYENYLGLLKKSISHSRFPLQEAANRILEKINIMYSDHENTIDIEKYKLSNECDGDNHIFNKNQEFIFYQTITLTSANYNISSKVPKNNYIMLITNEVALVRHIYKDQNGNIFLNVYTFNKYSSFFDVPLESFIIGSVIVDITSLQSNLKRISVNDIKYKCFFVPLSTDKAVVMTLSHNVL